MRSRSGKGVVYDRTVQGSCMRSHFRKELFAITLCRELVYGCTLEKKLVCDRTLEKDSYTIAL
jgi:hypothetical protein